MTKNEIIEQLAKDRMVEEIIKNCIINRTYNREDIRELAQDIYLSLLSKSEDLIVRLYDEGKLKFFIVRMVISNIVSVNSPYYTHYYKWSNNRSTFHNSENNIEDSDEIKG